MVSNAIPKHKAKTIPIKAQSKELSSKFGGIVSLIKDGFQWLGELKPTPLSMSYNIRVVCQREHSRYHVSVYVDTPLRKAKGCSKLEHVYDQKEQRLCLYYPLAKEWNDTMSISRTIIPWTSEWLYFYEVWVITGKWLGGGLHPEKEQKMEDVVML